jgi:flagellar hook-associated protein 2
VAHTGQDVQGTINGGVAVGSGQQLMAPFNDTTISGLALRITSTGTGDFGNFTYSPGLAQRAQTAISNATDLISGYLTSSENDFKARLKFVNDEVASMETRVTAYETRLRQQYATLEATISTLKSQSTFLTNQVNSMNKSGN